MNARNCRGGGADPRGPARLRKGLAGLLGGAVLGAGLAGAGVTHAADSFSAEEGDRISVSYSLPAFPHEARRVNPGYAGVRYSLCTSGGTATGAPSSGDVDPEADYTGMCGIVRELQSNGNYSKQLKLELNTTEDDRAEEDEYFWLKLTDPDVRRPGSSTLSAHGGSHHVPLTVSIEMKIEDDD